MNKQLQKQLNNETETARYACTGCGRKVEKVSRLTHPLPDEFEEYCSTKEKCEQDRTFRKLSE